MLQAVSIKQHQRLLALSFGDSWCVSGFFSEQESRFIYTGAHEVLSALFQAGARAGPTLKFCLTLETKRTEERA